MTKLAWWRTPRSDPQALALAILGSIETTTTWRHNQLTGAFVLEYLYNRNKIDATLSPVAAQSIPIPGDGGRIASRLPWLADPVGVPGGAGAVPNIVRSTVDTVVSWLMALPDPVTISSDGAPFEDKYHVEEYGLALNSIFNTQETETTLRAIARDDGLYGTAFARPVFRKGQMRIEQLQRWQIFLDPDDVVLGNPSTIHVQEFVDREDLGAWLRALQGLDGLQAKLRAVKEAPTASNHPEFRQWSCIGSTQHSLRGGGGSDRVRILWSYRTATARGNNDGRTVLTLLDGAQGTATILLDMARDTTSLPVVICCTQPDPEGLYGTGFGHLMLPWQQALDTVFAKIQLSLAKYGHKKWLVPAGASEETITAALTAGIQIVEVAAGQSAPQLIDIEAVRKEDMMWVETCLSLSQSTYGVNQMMTRGATQLGAGASGVAQQEEQYRTLDRFAAIQAEWVAFRHRLAEETLNALDAALQAHPKFAASYEMLGHQVTREWADLRAQNNQSTVRVESRGAGALTRAGRTARIQEWAATGLLPADVATPALLNNPDVREAARAASMPFLLVEKQLRRVIEATDNDYNDAMPDEDTDAAIAVALATRTIQEAMIRDARPDTLQRLRAYKAAATRLVATASVTPPDSVEPAALPSSAEALFGNALATTVV